jgi:hypothetical protein
LALQAKSTTHLAHRFKADQLSMFFSVPKDKLISHPNFWYYFGYFDMKAMGYRDPVFIVPTTGSPGAPRSVRSVRVLDIFGNEQVRRSTSPLPAELAAFDGIVLVGQSSPRIGQ